MKRKKTFIILMGVVFVVLMFLVLFVDGLPTIFSSVMAFPFETLGVALRELALSGSLGNGLALSLCAGISLLPALLALSHRGEKALLAENVVLYCTSIVVFVVLFAMANPSWLFSALPYMTQEVLPVVKTVMGCTVWSFVVLWGVLRLVRMFGEGDTNKLLGYLRVVLYALCLIFVAIIAISCGSTLLDTLSGRQKQMDSVMAVIRFIASSLPYVLDIGITLSMLTLFDMYIAGDEQKIVKAAGLLSSRCCLALGVTAGACVILNVLQLLLSRFLSDVSVKVEIPVVSLAFSLLILLLSRLVVENRRLQSDNDLFI